MRHNFEWRISKLAEKTEEIFQNTAHTDKEILKYETEIRNMEMAQKFQNPCNGMVERQHFKKYW